MHALLLVAKHPYDMHACICCCAHASALAGRMHRAGQRLLIYIMHACVHACLEGLRGRWWIFHIMGMGGARAGSQRAPGERVGELQVLARKIPLQQAVQVGVPLLALALQRRQRRLLQPLQAAAGPRAA